jgi:hypothetical protein
MQPGQLTMEFMTYLGIVLFIVVLASFATISTGKDAQSESDQREAREIASKISSEINMAVEIGDGFYHKFTIPNNFRDGKNYTAETYGRTVKISWEDRWYVLPFIAQNITGMIYKGENNISNRGGVVVIG